MCGIVGAVTNRNNVQSIIAGLKRLEYRGYDSAGIAFIDGQGQIERFRTVGKIHDLEEVLRDKNLSGQTTLAHTRWATHGIPSLQNAHPHLAGDQVAIVHNGIIENYHKLRQQVLQAHIKLESETDSELIAHLIYLQLNKGKSLLQASQLVATQLEGSFAIGVIATNEPHHLIALRRGSPLVIGLGKDGNYIASDALALLAQTNEFVYLEEGDIADIYIDKISIYDANGTPIRRKINKREGIISEEEKGPYAHFMLKEIQEQPAVCERLLHEHLGHHKILIESFGPKARAILQQTKRVHIVACGSSYHAGMLGKIWFETLANLPCEVQIASEYRYSKKIIEPNTLFISLSQSGETADTLAALRLAKQSNYLSTLTICNVCDSTIVRESDLVVMTQAGAEIGVASTKAFTAELINLLLLALVNKPRQLLELQDDLVKLPLVLKQCLALEKQIASIANLLATKSNALYLGRGSEFPIALEGALKLKEISYIHAEAYPAGELKHGPLALVDANMPVIALAPNNTLLPKLLSNLEEVSARDGKLIIFSDAETWQDVSNATVVRMPAIAPLLAPIIYTIPMQLLAYHVALIKGADIDQPRNLAKSVTVE